jgi:DNA invertase Pin-like site-specific DNA recombinase
MKFLENIEELFAFTKKFNNRKAHLPLYYMRVLTREQAYEEFSQEAREELLKKDADCLLIPNIYIFLDQETAKEVGRNGFGQLIEFYRKYVDRDNCPYFFVEKMDRLTGNDRDILTINDLVEEKGLIVLYVKENTPQSPDSKVADKFMLRIRSNIATFYSENLSEETFKGMTAKAEAGLYPSQAPIGYRNDPGTTRVDNSGQDFLKTPMYSRSLRYFTVALESADIAFFGLLQPLDLFRRVGSVYHLVPQAPDNRTILYSASLRRPQLPRESICIFAHQSH